LKNTIELERLKNEKAINDLNNIKLINDNKDKINEFRKI